MYEIVWHNGKLKHKKEVSIPIDSLGFLLGLSVFDTVRVYYQNNSDTIHAFRLMDHLNRFYESLHLAKISLKQNKNDVMNAVCELLYENKVKSDTYLRLTAYCNSSSTGSSLFHPNEVDYQLLITLSDNNLPNTLTGIRCTISSWIKASDMVMPPRIKTAANYQNVRLAVYQAKMDGYDNCLFLNSHGQISEAAESAILFFKNYNLIAPNINSDILPSITRDTILRIAKEMMKLNIEERIVDRSELLLADEIILVNTAKGIRSVLEIDHYRIGQGNIGNISLKLWGFFMNVARKTVALDPTWYTTIKMK